MRWSTMAIRSLAELADRADRDKVAALLAGEADANNTYVEINAGAGGTESQDWAEMLQRMYTRWAERHGMKVELIDYHAGEQAGIKSATLLIKGENAYGNLKIESGVHRLVRISPYDANARRHTSFSSVWVYPEVDEDIDIEVEREGPAHRHLPRVGRRRAARQHDRQRSSDHPPSDRHRRRLPERALAAQESRLGDEAVEGPAVRSRAAEARG